MRARSSPREVFEPDNTRDVYVRSEFSGPGYDKPRLEEFTVRSGGVVTNRRPAQRYTLTSSYPRQTL